MGARRLLSRDRSLFIFGITEDQLKVKRSKTPAVLLSGQPSTTLGVHFPPLGGKYPVQSQRILRAVSQKSPQPTPERRKASPVTASPKEPTLLLVRRSSAAFQPCAPTFRAAGLSVGRKSN